MKKMFATFVIATLILLTLIACDTDSNLEQYKEIAITIIEDYAMEDNYSHDNWIIVCNMVDAGKDAINDADTKANVDEAVSTTKMAIDAIEKKDVSQFYDLEEAFIKQWITQESLRDISFHYNGSSTEEFNPTPKNPETLSIETEFAIKQTYLVGLKKDVPEATIDGIRINRYYGTYDNCVIVSVWDDYRIYDLVFIPEKIIGGVLFRDYCAREIYVWLVK